MNDPFTVDPGRLLTPFAPLLPSVLTIGAHVFELDMSDEAGRALRDRHNRGESNSQRAVIQVDNDLARGPMAATVVHEILHCIWDQTSLRVRYDGDQEEEVITALAPLLLDVIRRNPELLAWLRL